MASMLVQHQVKDFSMWKNIYDSLAELRVSKGQLSDKVYRDANNPNKLTILFNWNSLENAQEYAQSSELKEAMQEAGVEGPPTVSFLNEA